MKRIVLFFAGITLLWCGYVFAEEVCFLAKENENVVKQSGKCKVQYPPQSTFKIALSLIGFDSGILEDENNPSWSCDSKCDYFINVCKGNHTPKEWMRDSCLWYSRVLTQKLGMEKFQEYIKKFGYGNMDLSGNKGEDNGLTQAWVNSSLKISPWEQAEFLQKIIDKKLPVSSKSFEMTKKIMFVQEFSGGWKIYGKTGNGKQLNKYGEETRLQHGWFVGWIEKGDRKIIFASHIKDDKQQDVAASFRARNDALIKLWYLINELEG